MLFSNPATIPTPPLFYVNAFVRLAQITYVTNFYFNYSLSCKMPHNRSTLRMLTTTSMYSFYYVI